jgi:DNA replication protein DnaC
VDATDNGPSHTSAHVYYVIGSGGTGKSHLAQAIGQAVILQGYRVHYREAHMLLDDLADAAAAGTRKQFMTTLAARE